MRSQRLTMTFLIAFQGPLAFSPMFPQLIEAFGITPADAVQLVGICILVLGFANFIWVPISSTYGRRIVLLSSTLICIAANIWRATTPSYGGFIGSTVLNGIGAAPTEAFQPVITADIFFLHERGYYLTLYTSVYIIFAMIGPIVSGAMTTNIGWRSFWWLNVGLQGLMLVLLLVAFPETKFDRDSTVVQSLESASQIRPSDTKQSREGLAEITEAQSADIVAVKGAPGRHQFPLFVWRKLSTDSLATTLARDVLLPLKLVFFYPIVQFSSFVYMFSSSNYIILNLTQSGVFGAPPYNFSSQSVGFTNFASGVGALIGFFTAGPLSDWFAMRLTMRNGGIREPEMRLPVLIPYTIISFIGSLIVCLGYQYQWSWEIIVIIGYTLVGIQVAAIPGIVATYEIDSYKPAAAEFMVATTIYKNVWGYGVSKCVSSIPLRRSSN